MNRRFSAIALLAFLTVTIAGLLAPRPTRVLGTEAAPEEFSAGRAVAMLTRLLGDQRPHPTGSPANLAVRARLEAELRVLGLEPRVLRGTSCGKYALCAEVENVVAEIPGRIRTPAIALAAHYDSVSAGPAAADDGSGVAALLEIARALHRGPALERSLWLLFTDGEEMGLLGAQALAKERELLQKIGLIVNVEARGVRGPSLMFETSSPNDALISIFADSAVRPVTSSAFYAVYKKLPNDTDLTVFRRAGLPGINFAFLGGTAHYHTPQDDLAHLSHASLQHQGEQALSLVRVLLERGVPESRHDAVFFDVLSLGVVHAPVPVFRAAALVLVLAGAWLWWRALGRDREARRGVRWAAAAAGTAFLLAIAGSVPLDLLLRARGSLDQPWPANGPWIAAAAASIAGFAISVTAGVWARRYDVRAAFLGLWAILLLLTTLAAVSMPEAAYLFAAPAFVATLLGGLLPTAYGDRIVPFAVLGTAVANAVMWAPVVGLAYDALGVAMPSLSTALSALLLFPLLPLAAVLGDGFRRTALRALGAAALLATGAAAAMPARSPENPARVNLGHHTDLGTGRARWLLEASRLPPELAAAIPFVSNAADDYPWYGAHLVAKFQAPAPASPRPAPELTLDSEAAEGGGRRLELSFSAGDPEALAVSLGFPVSARVRASIDGEPATLLDVGSRSVLGVVSPARRKVRLTVHTTDRAPLPLRIAEIVSGLPASAKRLATIRDGLSTASQTGDITVVSRDLTL